MQKKVLLPLVLTVPAAMPALANVPLGFPEATTWEKSGITSQEWIDYANKKVNCPVGTAYVTVNFGNLPKGKYFLRFADATNTSVSVKGGNVLTVPSAGGATDTFDFEGGNLEIKIKATNESIGFSFQIQCIVLEVAESAYNNPNNLFRSLETEVLWNDVLEEVTAEDDFQEAIDLRAQRAAIRGFVNDPVIDSKLASGIEGIDALNGKNLYDILKDIQKMAASNSDITEMEDSEKWIELYKTYGLDKDPSTILAYIQAIKGQIDPYNEAVKAENAVWQRYLDNVATRTTLLDEQATLLANAEALQADIDKFAVADPKYKEAYEQSINAYIEKLNQYKASIEAAYPDPAGENRRALREEITFEDQNNALTTEFNGLVDEFNTFKTQYQHYYDINFLQLTNLKNAYDAYVEFLKGVKGVEGYETVYNDLVYGGDDTENPTADSKLGTANSAYETTKNENQFESIAAVTEEEYQAKKAAIEAQITAWQTLTDDFKSLVETQNNNMTTCQEWIAEKEAKVTEYNKFIGKIPENYKDEFESKLKAVTDAIANYKNLVEGQYKIHSLFPDFFDVETAKNGVDKAIEDMDNFLTPMQVILDLYSQLEAAKAEVANNSNQTITDAEGNSKTVNISDRFNSTYDGLYNSIKALTLEEAQNTDITDPIVEAIKKYQADATTYANNLKAVSKAITDMVTKYTELQYASYKKVFDTFPKKDDTDVTAAPIDNTNLAAVKAQYADSWKTMFDTPIKGYRNDLYQAVIRLDNDQDSFTTLANLLTTVTATFGDNGLFNDNSINTQKGLFSIDGSLANWNFGAGLFKEFKALLESVTRVGTATNPNPNFVTNADQISTADIEDTLGERSTIPTYLTMLKQQPTSGFVANMTEQDDKDVYDALKMLQALKDKLAKYQDTQNNYNDLLGKYNAMVPGLQDLIQYNQDNSLAPALEYYANDVIGTVADDSKAGTLGKQIFDFKAAIDAALQATKISTGAENDAFQKTAADLIQAIADTKAAIEANNTAHDKQLEKEKEERAHALDVIKQIEEIGQYGGSSDLPVMKNWKDALQAIIDNDIVNENVVVTNAYGKGESVKQDEAIMAVYNDIHDRIQAIEDQLNGDEYMEAVKDANKLTTQNWNASYYQPLMDQWKKAIQDYNYYYYDVNNEGWKNFIHEEIKRHWDQFSSHADIDKLDASVKTFIALSNSGLHVITQEEWAKYTAEADEISATIQKRVDALQKTANELAQEYYTQQHDAAANAISDAEAALEAAGIDATKPLEAANGFLATAEGLYTKANPAEEYPVNVLGGAMDAIADQLDQVIPAIDVQKACEEAWAAKYADAQTQIEKWVEQIEAAEFCQKDVKVAWTLKFNEENAQAINLNTEVRGIKVDLIDSYKQYADDLDAILENMQFSVDQIQKSNDINVENQKIFNEFTEWKADILNQFQALEEFVGALGASGDMQGTLNKIEGAIEALSDFVDATKDDLVNRDIKSQCENIETKIADAYQTAGDTEISWLRNMLRTTQTAFNDAMVKGTGTLDERLTAMGSDKTQDGIEAEIHAFEPALGESGNFAYSPDDKEGFKTTAQGYEKDLCGLYDLLQSTWNEVSPSTAIKAALDELYNAIDGKITEGQAALGECEESVQTEYAGQYEALKSALDAQKAAWDANGADVIAREASYKRELEKIQNSVNDLAASVDAAQKAALEKAEKERVNAEKYAELKAQYDDLQKRFDEAKTLVESYGNGIAGNYEYMAGQIQGLLDNSLASLEDANTNVALTAESVLQYADYINTAIDGYRLYATRDYAAVQFSTLSAQDSELSGKLRDLHIVPAVFTEIENALATLRDNVSPIRSEYRGASFERLNEIIEEAKGYIEQYNDLIAKADSNSYIIGDVNLDGSVNVLDAQALINLIGEGVTYDELYAQNPLEACAADVLDDDSINIADVTSIVGIVLGEDFNQNRVRAFMPMPEATASANLMLVSEENGVSRYALLLNNPEAFTAAQFDITVGGTSKVVSVAASERTAEHDLYVFETVDGGARVVLANMENKAFNGNDGVLVYIDVEGDNKISTVNALFTDRNNRLHSVKDAHTSAIDTIIDGVKNGAERIWDAAGRGFTKLQKGINIIRHKDGRVTKEMHK